MELQQLLKECKQNSLTAQKYLFDKYAGTYFMVCNRYMKTNEQAEECMMNGFLKLFQSLQHFTFINNTATEGWMKKIMVNECLMELRKKQNFNLVPEEEATGIIINEEALSSLSANEIFSLIKQLPLGYRTVFNLFVIENCSHKEIAEQLQITEGTSKSQLNKARHMLQQLLQNQNNYYAKQSLR
jgi:RNA polymerase sigma factor (sigma-70 family)